MENSPPDILDISFFKRRSSFFKPALEDHDIDLSKQSLSRFMHLCRQEQYSVSKAPMTWERLLGYRIVDFPVDRTNEALELLKAYYFCSSQSCEETTLYIDSYTLHKYELFILNLISNNNSFCAIEEGTGEMVGVVLTKIMLKKNEEQNVDNFSCGDVFNVIKYEKTLLKEANIFKKYKVNKYFCIHVLCVKPKYYGKGIGTLLIQACLSKAVKRQSLLCIGIFAEGPSQTIAQKFEFEKLCEKPWIKIRKFNTTYSPIELSHIEKSFVTCMGLLLPKYDNAF